MNKPNWPTVAMMAALLATAAFVYCWSWQTALAQFAPSGPPAPVAIGGPVGSPTYVVPPSPGFLDVGQAFGTAVQPFVDAALQSVLAAGLAWLAYILKKKFDINITEGQRDAVQTWLTNQAASLIADGAVTIKDGKVSVNDDALMKHAHEYAQQIPDAAKFFGLTPERLAAKIVDKIPQVPAGAQLIAQSAAPSPPVSPSAAGSASGAPA